jgi:hypothetical protein
LELPEYPAFPILLELGMHNGFLQKVAKFCKKGGI